MADFDLRGALPSPIASLATRTCSANFPRPLGEHPDVLGRLAETLRRCPPSTATRQVDAGDPLVLLPSEGKTRSDSRQPRSRGDQRSLELFRGRRDGVTGGVRALRRCILGGVDGALLIRRTRFALGRLEACERLALERDLAAVRPFADLRGFDRPPERALDLLLVC